MARTVTARSLIVGVFRMLGITAQGEDPTAGELLDAFARLNEVIDAWELERLTQRVTSRTEYALTSGQASYTIAPTGTTPTPDWTGARPVWVSGVSFILPDSDPDTELTLGDLTEAAYEALPQKSLETSIPTLYRYEATVPAGTFTFWPVPDTAGTVAVYATEALAQFAALTTEYVLAPGYTRALRFALAREIAPEFGKVLTPEQAGMARESLAALKRANVPMMDLAVDAGLTPNVGRAGYNIYTDTP